MSLNNLPPDCYVPSTFTYHIDETTGLRKYDDPKLQKLYLNLRIISKSVWELQTRAQIDLLDAQNNCGASAVKDQTAQILGMFASKLFEGLSVFFPQGTGAAIAAMIIGRAISGVITVVVQKSDPQSDIQKKANEIRSGMDAIFSALKKEIDLINSDFESRWSQPIHCQGYLDPQLSGDIYLGQLANFDQLLPDDTDPNWDDFMQFMQKRNLYIIVSQLLSAKWKVKRWPSYQVKDNYHQGGGYHYDFDYLQYNPHIDDDFWCQKFVGIPERDFGSYFLVNTTNDNKTSSDFSNWLSNICLTGSWYQKYSSYWNRLEAFTYQDGSKQFSGNWVHSYVMVDSNGDFAPTSLTEWLFISGEKGIATKEDVYQNWLLPTYGKVKKGLTRSTPFYVWTNG